MKSLNLHRRPGYEDKKTIIFDIDETLIHCVENIVSDNPHVVLTIQLPNGGTVKAGVNIRPYVKR